MGPSTQQRTRRAGTGRAAGMGGRSFLLLLAATFGTFSNYAPLLSVTPLWSAEGGSGNTGVGAATGMTMATTVGVQLCMRRLFARFTLRQILIQGALLLGLPTFAYPVSADLGWVLTICAVRGVGFGMVAVAGSALVAELVPPERRGRGVGCYGIAVGLPQVLCLPLGVWGAQHIGFTTVFVAAGALSVLAAPLAAGIGVREERAGAQAGGGDPVGEESAGGGSSHLAGPFVLLIVAACALGGVTSFLPLALERPSAAPWALFLLSAAVVAGRWAAGVVNDRAGLGRLLVPGMLACAVGMGGFGAAAALDGGAVVVAAVAATLYGAGFGALQNDTLVVMFRRARQGGHGRASTLWNMAYDAGTGIGALAVGVCSQLVGLDGAFTGCAVLILLAAHLALRDARFERRADRAAAGERRKGMGQGTQDI
ncbi:MFS transporter [Streptomyces sp. NPDC048491]|uniref:MFS transporter n=1 Tax=Streptomyces sp. NPDC048491 TaxID=3157207 RepID=UPI003443ACBB